MDEKKFVDFLTRESHLAHHAKFGSNFTSKCRINRLRIASLNGLTLDVILRLQCHGMMGIELGFIDQWSDGQMDGQRDRQTDGCKDLVITMIRWREAAVKWRMQ